MPYYVLMILTLGSGTATFVPGRFMTHAQCIQAMVEIIGSNDVEVDGEGTKLEIPGKTPRKHRREMMEAVKGPVDQIIPWIRYVCVPIGG